MSRAEIANSSFQVFICFVFISVYAPISVSLSLDPHEHCGFLNASGRKSIHWRGDGPQTSMDTGENAKAIFYNRCRLNGAIY